MRVRVSPVLLLDKRSACRLWKTMYIDWSLLLSALGLAFIIEGMPYFLWAERMPRVLKLLAESPVSSLRRLGVTAILAGLLLIYIARS
jgi:hypothetical protein